MSAAFIYELIIAFGGAIFGALLPAIIAAGGTIVLAKALVTWLNYESFDVYAWPGNSANPSSHGEQTAFIGAYLLSVLPSKLRFVSWLGAASLVSGGYAKNFPPFLGLSAFGDTVTTVRNSFLKWFNASGGTSPASFPPTGISDDGQSDFPNSADPFATAVAVILGAGNAAQTKLVTLLTDLAKEFSASRKEQLAIFDNNNAPLNGGLKFVTETVRPALNYLAAVALAWFFAKMPTTAAASLPANFPVPPAPGTNLPSATIPKQVIEQSFGFPTAAQVIPLSGLPPLPNPLPPEIDLFAANAPSKPVTPPLPVNNTTWILSTTVSHSGNWFGDSNTETLNAGQMLATPGCSILGVKLFLVDKHGAPLGGVPTSTALGRASKEAGVPPWPSPLATDVTWPFTAGARILSIGATPNDMSVTVNWWYHTGRVCRYQIAYLVQGLNCVL